MLAVRSDFGSSHMPRHVAASRFVSSRVCGGKLIAVIFFFTCVFFPVGGVAQQSSKPTTLRGTIRDAQGKALASAMVHLQPKDGTQSLTTQTDQQGNYSFLVLHEGVYSLRVEMSGYGDAVQSIFMGSKDAKVVDLTLELVAGKAAALESAKASGARPDSSAKPQFFDQPQFTVSGVTDTTSLGGHGSDTIVRTRETLARETVSLGKPSAAADPVATAKLEKSLQEQEERNPESFDASHHHQLADVREKLGDSLDAVREYQRAAELDPREPYFFDWGSELLLHHAPEPAIEVFIQGNRLFPKSVRMLIGLGAASFTRGDFDEAVRRISAASDLDPNDPGPYLFLGKMEAAQTGASDELVALLRRFATVHPENAAANYYYAVALWKQQKASPTPENAAKVESLLRNALRIDSNYAAAHLQMGILFSERHDSANAIAEFQQVTRISQDGTSSDMTSDMATLEEAHYRLAQAYRESGQPDKAKNELKTYAQMAKESAQKTEEGRHALGQFLYTLRDQPPNQ